eukprot:CAMPEP_0175081738 /NCGR_PEP_ID=MMETSP0052_2-20121109/26331_1 /TAXON_ID=51329 ORGANISM="Polytomella parva, Strain SAG 63-3" /NCGR_SAMPLE_ID=MMETSP0052_2 /ASSEMBLY_ACC=CAM_ASM_000194 /LENGTH=612 /DNA_ID=CAMNT_0016352785 /DNA_START=186 /DNA_END=2024 /DNA_ORIENTATION=-
MDHSVPLSSVTNFSSANFPSGGANPLKRPAAFEISHSTESDDEDKLDEKSNKKIKTEANVAASRKACREKARREKLNERFHTLSKLIDPAGEPKSDKTTILGDAIKFVQQVTVENHQLKQLNKFLEERVASYERERGQMLYQRSLTGGFLPASSHSQQLSLLPPRYQTDLVISGSSSSHLNSSNVSPSTGIGNLSLDVSAGAAHSLNHSHAYNSEHLPIASPSNNISSYLGLGIAPNGISSVVSGSDRLPYLNNPSNRIHVQPRLTHSGSSSILAIGSSGSAGGVLSKSITESTDEGGLGGADGLGGMGAINSVLQQNSTACGTMGSGMYGNNLGAPLGGTLQFSGTSGTSGPTANGVAIGSMKRSMSSANMSSNNNIHSNKNINNGNNGNGNANNSGSSIVASNSVADVAAAMHRVTSLSNVHAANGVGLGVAGSSSPLVNSTSLGSEALTTSDPVSLGLLASYLKPSSQPSGTTALSNNTALQTKMMSSKDRFDNQLNGSPVPNSTFARSGIRGLGENGDMVSGRMREGAGGLNSLDFQLPACNDNNSNVASTLTLNGMGNSGMMGPMGLGLSVSGVVDGNSPNQGFYWNVLPQHLLDSTQDSMLRPPAA